MSHDAHAHKPSPHHRASLTRKGENEEPEIEGKPTLARRSATSGTPTRQQRIVEALDKLTEERLRTLTTRIGADELAVALLDADTNVKRRIAGCLNGEYLDLFNQYLSMGKEKLPKSVIDEVQGKLLRLAING